MTGNKASNWAPSMYQKAGITSNLGISAHGFAVIPARWPLGITSPCLPTDREEILFLHTPWPARFDKNKQNQDSRPAILLTVPSSKGLRNISSRGKQRRAGDPTNFKLLTSDVHPTSHTACLHFLSSLCFLSHQGMLSVRGVTISSAIFTFWKKTQLSPIRAPLTPHLLHLRSCQGHIKQP